MALSARTSTLRSASWRRSCTTSSPDRSVDDQCTDLSPSPSRHGRTPSISPAIAPGRPANSPPAWSEARVDACVARLAERSDDVIENRNADPAEPPHHPRHASRSDAHLDVVDAAAAGDDRRARELTGTGPTRADHLRACPQLDPHRSAGVEFETDRERFRRRRQGRHRQLPDDHASQRDVAGEQSRREPHQARRQQDHDRRRAGEPGDRQPADPRHHHAERARRHPGWACRAQAVGAGTRARHSATTSRPARTEPSLSTTITRWASAESATLTTSSGTT